MVSACRHVTRRVVLWLSALALVVAAVCHLGDSNMVKASVARLGVLAQHLCCHGAVDTAVVTHPVRPSLAVVHATSVMTQLH